MNLDTILAFIRHPRNKPFRWLLSAVIILDIIDTLPTIVDKEHAHTTFESIPGFWTVFGLVGCIAIILLSKWFGHAGIMTREDYYDE